MTTLWGYWENWVAWCSNKQANVLGHSVVSVIFSWQEYWKSESESHSVVSDSLWPHGHPWNSPGQNTGLGSLSLLQGIFPTQGSNPGLPHFRWILYQLSHKGSPRILEWVVYPFSSGSSQRKNWTRSPELQVDSLPAELVTFIFPLLWTSYLFTFTYFKFSF